MVSIAQIPEQGAEEQMHLRVKVSLHGHGDLWGMENFDSALFGIRSADYNDL